MNMSTRLFSAILALICVTSVVSTTNAQCGLGTAYLWSTLTPATINVPVIATGTWKQNIIDLNVVSGRTYSVGNCAVVNGTNPSPAAGTSVTVRDNTMATVIAFASGPGQVCATFVAPYTGVVRAYLYNDLCANETVSFTAGAVWGGCAPPMSLGVTNLMATSATLNWSAATLTTPLSYEYALTTSATPPATGTPTTNTTFSTTTLTPTTQYYLHVKQDCGAPTGWSGWSTYNFTTPAIPPCLPPGGINITNLTTASATLNWSAAANSVSYDYVVDQNPADPISSTGLTNLTATSDNITGLTEGNWYYIHLRTNCTLALTPSSPWALDSFLTPIKCYPPALQIAHLNTDESVVYWEPINSATEYEYAITTSPNPPYAGTRYNNTYIHFSSLKDGKSYFVHVRANCNSLGTVSYSPWSTAPFATWAASVHNVNNNNFDIEAYPNPASDVVNIAVKGSLTANAKAMLCDMTGRALQTISITDVRTSLNISNLPAGNYMLKYEDGMNKRVIKINKK
jgi:hypothetical protein